MKSRIKNGLIGLRDGVLGETTLERWECAFWLAVCLSLAFLFRSLLHSLNQTIVATAITYTLARSLFWMLSKRPGVSEMTTESGCAPVSLSLLILTNIIRALKSESNQSPLMVQMSKSDYQTFNNQLETYMRIGALPRDGQGVEMNGVKIVTAEWLDPGLCLVVTPSKTYAFRFEQGTAHTN